MPLVVITGATRGIGKAAAVELARQGAEVAIVGRESERVQVVAAEARAAGNAPVHEHVADLTLMSSVRALADELRHQYEHIDVLANNAGALFASRRETEEGFERTFALNHLAPFLLTNLVRDRLEGGRVVTTASDAHEGGRLDLDDLQSKDSSYAAMRVYGTSKLCNILFTRELARRAPELHANCFHPGVVRTGFGKNENGIWKVLTTLGSPFFRSPERGARSLVWLALSDEAANLNGEYVQDEKVATPNAQAQDDELARGLWERSAELAGLPADAPA
jgi:NAD(P)-dependent dehydrogenase (short-subunit alcohol dehydrogenase family)